METKSDGAVLDLFVRSQPMAGRDNYCLITSLNVPFKTGKPVDRTHRPPARGLLGNVTTTHALLSTVDPRSRLMYRNTGLSRENS